MKVIIPVEAKLLNASVCQSFGRTPFFALVDTQGGERKFIENFAINSQGGAGIRAAQIIVDSGAEAIITYRCGQNAADVLKAANVKIYKAEMNSVDENIENLKKRNYLF